MKPTTQKMVYSSKIFIKAFFRSAGHLRISDWFLVAIFCSVILTLIFFVHFEVSKNQLKAERRYQKVIAQRVYNLMETAMEHRLLAMDRLANRYASKNEKYYQNWKNDSQKYFQDMPGFLAIQWVTKENKLHWLYPENTDSPLFGKVLNQDPERQQAMSLALKNKRGEITPPIDLIQGGRGFVSFHPTFRGREHTGFMVGVYRANDYFNSLIQGNFSVNIRVNNQELFASNSDDDIPRELNESFVSKFRGQVFKIMVSPRESWSVIQERLMSSEKPLIYLLSLTGSLLMFVLIFLLGAYRNIRVSLEEKLQYQKQLLENFEKVTSSEQLLFQAQSLAKLGNWSFDLVTGVLSWSDQMYEIFPENRSKGEPDFERHKMSIHPEDRALWQQTVEQCTSDGKPYIMHFRTVHEDEKIVWVEARGEGRKDENGNLVSLYGTCQDVSEKKQMEEVFQQQEKITQHQSRLAALGQLAAGVGHEINNPLTIITGYLEIIEKKLFSQNAEDSRNKELFGKLKMAVFRIQQITQGLRNFSRQEDAEWKELSLLGEINKTLAVSEEIFIREGVRVEFNPIAENICFQGPQGQLQQVLLNLMMNAKDAMTSSQIKKISITCEIKNGTVNIQVKDTGPGVPENIREKIFDPFFTTKGVNEGTGLGLSISQKILKDHAGDLRLLQSNKHGSIFELSFPIHVGAIPAYSDTEPSYGKEVSFSSVEVSKKFEVLVVDDEADILTIIQDKLVNFPIKVTLARNGKEALKTLKVRTFDLLLTDLKMSEMDGETLLSNIFEHNLNQNMKIFVMTGGVEQALETNFQFRSRIDKFFLKPFGKDFNDAFEEFCADSFDEKKVS